jgi:anthranilate phosphoribosyltransferase
VGLTLDELGGWPAVLTPLMRREDLDADHTAAALRVILDGEATAAQIAGFIVALRMKGETVEEISGLLRAMLEAAELVPVSEELRAQLVDTCGTGGDRSHSVNVSTIAALVVAGAGVPVCKHGNRSQSSVCGSGDVLEALGVTLELSPAAVARCIDDAGIGFCFAPRFHPAMRHAGPPRRELGVPTVFNFLGPMANPARVRRQVVGVSDPAMAEMMIAVLQANGAERAWVVYGHDGLDELTTTTTSSVYELRDGEVRTHIVDPQALGLPAADAAALRGGDVGANAGFASAVLEGKPGPHRDIVMLNAGAALVTAGAVDDLAAGLVMAAAAIDDGSALSALERLVAASNAEV